MSIKTITIVPVRPGLVGHQSKSTADPGDDFASQLEQSLSRSEKQAPGLSRAALQARLLALTLSRGLLEDEPVGAEDYFPSLPMAARVRPGEVAAIGRALASQNFDIQIRPFDQAEPSERTETPSLDKIIERAAGSHGLDPQLIRAVIRTESNFDPDAQSPAGAQGLMQLMPETARELGVTNPFDPEQNVMAGTRYLRQLLDRYDGDVDRALAAYNWGMGNVERKGMERMPRETRDYLVKIKAEGSWG